MLRVKVCKTSQHAGSKHEVTMPALSPNAWDGERLEVRSLGRQCFGFGWRQSRAWAFWACRSPKARNHPPPPTPTPNPQNLPKVAETTRAGTRRTPTTLDVGHCRSLSSFWKIRVEATLHSRILPRILYTGPHPKPRFSKYHLGALMIRTGLWGFLYYTYNKEP